MLAGGGSVINRAVQHRRCASLCHELSRTITAKDVECYAELTGDKNPIHLSSKSAVVHGAFLIGLVSSVMGTKCPGPGTKVLELSTKFAKPCPVGTTVTVKVELSQKRKLSVASFCVMDKTNATLFAEGQAKLYCAVDVLSRQ